MTSCRLFALALSHLTNFFSHMHIFIKNFLNFIVYLALNRIIFLFVYLILFFIFSLHCTIDTAPLTSKAGDIL